MMLTIRAFLKQPQAAGLCARLLNLHGTSLNRGSVKYRPSSLGSEPRIRMLTVSTWVALQLRLSSSSVP